MARTVREAGIEPILSAPTAVRQDWSSERGRELPPEVLAEGDLEALLDAILALPALRVTASGEGVTVERDALEPEGSTGLPHHRANFVLDLDTTFPAEARRQPACDGLRTSSSICFRSSVLPVPVRAASTGLRAVPSID